ncbi:MAG: saccharopine dehydrogenase C-terminal domain-containing protein [Ginsengibacter sp.]
MKTILVIGAGKSATILIEYLCNVCSQNKWKLTVCDADQTMAESKIKNCVYAQAISINITIEEERRKIIAEADIVISMLPPQLHILAAQSCIELSKNLLTASYADKEITSLNKQIKKKGLLFICELGLDPGIDHMSAMKIIDKIRLEGGKVHSFISHCGGLVAPESDDNPWHYKITWNPRNIVLAGANGAVFRLRNNKEIISYSEVFKNCQEVSIPGLFPLAWYPNRDSLSYIENYGLQGAETFIRTTLRQPSFCKGWNTLVQANFTSYNDEKQVRGNTTYLQWFNNKLKESGIDPTTLPEEFFLQIDYLGMRDNVTADFSSCSSGEILQSLMERKLAMKTDDKDMIVMLHEIAYTKNDLKKTFISSLIVKGDDQLHTAMAKTVGLPLGIAAKLILQSEIKLTGLHIPILPEIYNPVLAELEKHSIKFFEKDLPDSSIHA